MVLLFVLSLVGSYVVFKSINWLLERKEEEAKKLEAQESKKRALKIKEKVKRAKRKKA
jgi:hypothetical protein